MECHESNIKRKVYSDKRPLKKEEIPQTQISNKQSNIIYTSST